MDVHEQPTGLQELGGGKIQLYCSFDTIWQSCLCTGVQQRYEIYQVAASLFFYCKQNRQWDEQEKRLEPLRENNQYNARQSGKAESAKPNAF